MGLRRRLVLYIFTVFVTGITSHKRKRDHEHRPHPGPDCRQNEILEFIRHALSTRGVPPTREEIARAFGFRSLNASEQHLQALQRKGLIELLAGTSRGIRLKGGTQDSIGAAAREFGLPLIGKVAAGSPILALENVLKHPVVDAAVFKPRADYLLEVRGMRHARCRHPRWRLAGSAPAGAGIERQIVVARLGDEGHRQAVPAQRHAGRADRRETPTTRRSSWI